MTKLSIFLLALVSLACVARTKVPSDASFVCEVDTSGLAGSIAEWARSSAAEADSSGQRFRAEYGITGATRAEWDRQIVIVGDSQACRQAAIAYAESAPIRAGIHRVALVAVGNRYVAVDLGAVKKAGEFILEAVLDRRFRILHMLGT